MIVNRISSHTRWKRGVNFTHQEITDADPEKLMVVNHTHDVLQITLFERISADFVIDGQTLEIHDGDIFVIEPDTAHEIRFRDPRVYKRYCVWMTYDFVPERLRANLFTDSRFLQRASTPVIDGIFRKLDHYSAVFDDDTFENLLKWLSFEILYNVQYIPKERPHQAINSSMADSVLSYVNTNLHKIRTVDDICVGVHISKRHLHDLFRKLCGSTPMEYIRKKRLTLAREALQRGEKALAVSMECGFSSYSSFYRAYVQMYGHPPSEEPRIPYPQMSVRERTIQ